MNEQELNAIAKAFDHSDLAYCIIRLILDDAGSPCDWEFVYLNDALAGIEGLPKEKLLNKRFFEVFPQADTKWVQYYYPAAFQGKSFTVQDISEEIGVYLRIHCFPVAQGYCGCILEDIRELQESLKREHEGDSLTRGLAREYDMVWLVTAPEMTMQLYQHAGHHAIDETAQRHIHGRPYEQGVKMYIQQYVAAEDRERMLEETALERVKAAISQENVYTVHYRRMVENRYVYYQVSFAPVEGSESFVLALRNVNEIVQDQQKQEQALQTALISARQANAAKTKFLSNMSHDIRTPMNAIIGFTTLALTHISSQTLVQDYLKKIAASSKHLLSLINDVLDMSRIESGKMHLDEAPCSLAEVLHDLHSMVLYDLKAKSLKLTIDTVDVVDEQVICDRLRLNQMLMNIVGNAIKFTPPGGSIAIRLMQKPGRSADTGCYVFCIRDTGIGMEPAFMAHLFEPFERERSSTVSGIQGTGLGMAITKNIADMMHGTLDVQSEKGAGTEFVLTLPLRKVHDDASDPVVDACLNMHALVVDDDEGACDSLTHMLGQMGLRAAWCMSGREAVQQCRQAMQQYDPYELYLIDWQMPDMDGVEVARRLRREVGDDAPIIIVTAYDWGEIEEEAKAAGVTALLTKPLFLSGLKKGLTDILQAQQLPNAQPKAPQPKPVSKRLLLAEDNELNREIVTELLKEAGFTVETAENGREAVDCLTAHSAGHYDLVLMDIQMPVMDGYAATKAIRALKDSALASIPIVAMTADAFEEDKRKALQMGMNAHVAKPIDLHQLLETLEKLLG